MKSVGKSSTSGMKLNRTYLLVKTIDSSTGTVTEETKDLNDVTATEMQRWVKETCPSLEPLLKDLRTYNQRESWFVRTYSILQALNLSVKEPTKKSH
jgi:hypothetical protein